MLWRNNVNIGLNSLWRNQVSLQLVAKACRVPLGFINYCYDYDYANVALFFGWGDIFDGENDITIWKVATSRTIRVRDRKQIMRGFQLKTTFGVDLGGYQIILWWDAILVVWFRLDEIQFYTNAMYCIVAICSSMDIRFAVGFGCSVYDSMYYVHTFFKKYAFNFNMRCCLWLWTSCTI